MATGMIGTLVFNSVVVYPGLRAVLTTKRVPSLTTRKVLGVLFLAFVGLCSGGLDLVQELEERNLFKVMELPRTASDKDVRVAYQHLAKVLHPDRNPEAGEDRFVEMKQAYDVLSNPQRRQTYDQWGYDGLHWLERGEDVQSQGLMQIGVSYTIFFALTILLTVQSSDSHSRTICLAGLSLMLALELHLKTAAEPPALVLPFFSHLAIYQLCKLLFMLYPTYISGTVAFQSVTFVNAAKRNTELLLATLQLQKRIFDNMNDLENELRLTSKAGALPTVGAAGPSTANMPAAVGGAGGSLPRNLQAKNADGAASAAAAGQAKAKKGIPSWVYMLGMYILFNYVLK